MVKSLAVRLTRQKIIAIGPADVSLMVIREEVMRSIISIFLGCMVIASCGVKAPAMQEVMTSCNTMANFTEYAECIRSTYERDVELDSVKSFYGMLDNIDSDYKAGKITDFQSRVNAQKAYDMTIGVENERIRRRNAAIFQAMSDFGASVNDSGDDNVSPCDKRMGRPYWCY